MAVPTRLGALPRPLCSSGQAYRVAHTVAAVAGLCATFTSSARLEKTPAGKTNKPTGAPKRGTKTTYVVRKKKKGQESKGKPPAPGERKAMRKRIVLSNTNAFEVKDAAELSAQNMTDPGLEGSVITIPDQVVDQLRATQAFKPTQSWKFFRKPGMLIRNETLDLAKRIDDLSSEGSSRVMRSILVGEKASGKSLHLLQAMTFAFLRDWIVITIPEAQDLTNAHTEYAPTPYSKPTTYIQKSYTAALLSRIAAANPELSKLQTTLKHSLPAPYKPSMPLDRLCALGASDADLAYPVFQALWAELTQPSRPRILLALDGLSHIMKTSEYKSASFEPVHAHDLVLVSWFVDYLSGKKELPNGGAVLAAMTRSNNPTVPTLDSSLKQLEANQPSADGNALPRPGQDDPALPFLLATEQKPGSGVTPYDPYFAYDERVLGVFSGEDQPQSTASASLALSSTPDDGATTSSLRVQRLPGLSRHEARGLMEYWARSGVLRSPVDARLVDEKWSVSGGGIIGELERSCLEARF